MSFELVRQLIGNCVNLRRLTLRSVQPDDRPLPDILKACESLTLEELTLRNFGQFGFVKIDRRLQLSAPERLTLKRVFLPSENCRRKIPLGCHRSLMTLSLEVFYCKDGSLMPVDMSRLRSPTVDGLPRGFRYKQPMRRRPALRGIQLGEFLVCDRRIRTSNFQFVQRKSTD